MLVIAHDRRVGESRIHYLPEGRVLQIDENTLLSRTGNYVIVQTGRDKYTLEAPSSINMTEKLLRFVPLETILEGPNSEDPVETLRKLEELAWSDGLSHDVRRFVRLYAALYGMRILDDVPVNYKETVALTVSRLTGEPIGKLIANKEEIMRNIRNELEVTLRMMTPEYLTKAVNAVISL